ncbi:hypothetical protein OAF82_00030 [bacterium]|nr:hypothetical protein [bacterium]
MNVAAPQSPLFVHGPQSCRSCFAACDGETLDLGDWRLVNNPGYYGSPTPETLVLGFSKGATQNEAAERGDFDSVAFAGCRNRLEAILKVLGVMPEGVPIDRLMTATSPGVGVASLVRCSLSMLQKGSWVTSGSVIPKAFKSTAVMNVIQTCATQHLTDLPSSVQRVIMLGVSDSYVRATSNLLFQIFPDARKINPMAVRTGQVTWTYATHPSPANGHFKTWLEGDPESSLGRKRTQAIAALRAH